MKRVLSSLLQDQPEHVMRDVFLRISSLPKLQVLREGIKLFMRHFLLRGSKKTLEPDARLRLEEAINIAEKALTSADAKMVL
jgi:nucleolar MIF4G domain-containing protein 1